MRFPRMKANFAAIVAALAVSLVAPGARAGAVDLAFSLGTWTFLGNGDYRPAEKGTFAAAGFMAGVTPSVEIGASVIPRLTPVPGRDIFLEAHAGLSVMGMRSRPDGQPAAFLNTLLDAGVLVGFHGAGTAGPAVTKHLFLRITPITLGNPYYGRRDRLYAIGIQYDPDARSTSIFMSVLSTDIFIRRRK